MVIISDACVPLTMLACVELSVRPWRVNVEAKALESLQARSQCHLSATNEQNRAVPCYSEGMPGDSGGTAFALKNMLREEEGDRYREAGRKRVWC